MSITNYQPLDAPWTQRTVLISGEGKGAWTYARLADSAEALGTRKAVRVRATVDGHETEVTLLPMGDGDHMFPMKATLRASTDTSAGDAVAITITHRD